jgi:hypothetical protein
MLGTIQINGFYMSAIEGKLVVSKDKYIWDLLKNEIVTTDHIYSWDSYVGNKLVGNPVVLWEVKHNENQGFRILKDGRIKHRNVYVSVEGAPGAIPRFQNEGTNFTLTYFQEDVNMETLTLEGKLEFDGGYYQVTLLTTPKQDDLLFQVAKDYANKHNLGKYRRPSSWGSSGPHMTIDKTPASIARNGETFIIELNLKSIVHWDRWIAINLPAIPGLGCPYSHCHVSIAQK